MSIFAGAYGSEAGVAALKWLPFGGLYLTGGLTPKNINCIKQNDDLFMQALLDKGRVSGMLHNVPIYAVMVEYLGERGAEYMGLKVAADIQSSASTKNESVSQKKISLRESEPAMGLHRKWVVVGSSLLIATVVMIRRLR